MNTPLLAMAVVVGSLALLAACTAPGDRPSPPAPAPVASQPASDAFRPVDEQFLSQFAATNRFRMGRPQAIRLTPDGSKVLFLRSGPRTFVQDLYEFDVATGRERVLLTAEQVLGGQEETLTAEELARRERMRMTSRGIASYSMSKDGSTLLVPLSGRLFVIDRATGQKKELRSDAGFPIDPKLSRDGKLVICVREGDVYATDVATGIERRLTTGANDTISHGTAEFVAQEEMSRFDGYWLSPDSTRLLYQRTDTTGMQTFHIADPIDPTKPGQTWPYPRTGGKNAEVSLAIINLADTQGPNGTPVPVWVQWDRAQFPYLTIAKWPGIKSSLSPDAPTRNGPPTIFVMNREQTHGRLLKVDPDTGATTTLLDERDDAWISLRQSCPAWLSDGSGFLWLSEAGGTWQLELRAPDGSLVRTLTKDFDQLAPREASGKWGPGFGLDDLIHLDSARRVAYVSASSDPTQTHVWRVPLDGASPARLSNGRGMFGATFSDDSPAWVESQSTLESVMRWVVRRDAASPTPDAPGNVAGEITSVAERPRVAPAPELVRVGRFNYDVAIIRPEDFETDRMYPVIVYVYGGPSEGLVNTSREGYLLTQWMANHGFIVVAIDGRGIEGRGRTWYRSIKGNLIDLPLQDQVDALRALSDRYHELDLSRVGIFGWSFGGYFSAMATMRRPDIFHCGIAGAPVADWMDYDTYYTERYMGLPEQNPRGYEASNVLTYCKDLRVPLLIIHGTADDNVYFMHSLKMTQFLFRAGRDFDFLPLAGLTHMVPEPLVTERLQRRMLEYFMQHLAPRH
ncbi:MAG: prolyl oligopeptidase family serine peptidase [Planctomycetota bacterium]|nr:prolyl oligopeptidase family serine peptidase [Planctomycetota bacterium]